MTSSLKTIEEGIKAKLANIIEQYNILKHENSTKNLVAEIFNAPTAEEDGYLLVKRAKKNYENPDYSKGFENLTMLERSYLGSIKSLLRWEAACNKMFDVKKDNLMLDSEGNLILIDLYDDESTSPLLTAGERLQALSTYNRTFYPDIFTYLCPSLYKTMINPDHHIYHDAWLAKILEERNLPDQILENMGIVSSAPQTNSSNASSASSSSSSSSSAWNLPSTFAWESSATFAWESSDFKE